MPDNLYNATRNWKLMYIEGWSTCIWQGNGVNSCKLCKLCISGEKIEHVDKFVYLSRMIPKDGKIDGEISRYANSVKNVAGSIWSIAKKEMSI